MTDKKVSNVTEFKPKIVPKEKTQTIVDALKKFIEKLEAEEDELLEEPFHEAMLLITAPSGMRTIPLNSMEALTMIGLFEVAKGTVIDSLYYDDLEDDE